MPSLKYSRCRDTFPFAGKNHVTNRTFSASLKESASVPHYIAFVWVHEAPQNLTLFLSSFCHVARETEAALVQEEVLDDLIVYVNLVPRNVLLGGSLQGSSEIGRLSLAHFVHCLSEDVFLPHGEERQATICSTRGDILPLVCLQVRFYMSKVFVDVDAQLLTRGSRERGSLFCWIQISGIRGRAPPDNKWLLQLSFHKVWLMLGPWQLKVPWGEIRGEKVNLALFNPCESFAKEGDKIFRATKNWRGILPPRAPFSLAAASTFVGLDPAGT